MSHPYPRRPRRPFARPNAPASRPRHAASPEHALEAPAPAAAIPPPSESELAAIAASPFTALGLHPAIVRAVVAEGYAEPTPVQAQVVPHALAGRDVLACAQTGTGKTAAFVMPILQRLAATPRSGRIRTLVLTPTRELAAQIAERVSAYGRFLPLGHAVIYGGVSQHRQEIALRRSPDLLIATPGRLLDLMQQGFVRLDAVTHFVLDEADRMLDMGFVHDVRRVASAIPAARQTLLFSATIPPAIEQLARGMLRDPARVSVTPAVTTATTVEQSVVFVPRAGKRALLEQMLQEEDVVRAIVFTRTKHGANRLSDQLERAGIGSAAIHGNKSQGARERALEAFRKGTTRVLVATDVASRGIDVEGISHVINFELPHEPESYVHRIGRTGRAGATGRAISFCDPEERRLLSDIERLIRCRLAVSPASTMADTGPAGAPSPAPATEASRRQRPRRYRGNRHFGPGRP